MHGGLVRWSNIGSPNSWNAARTVLAHGCFDVLHLGHVRHLKEAAALGDRLVVSITPDHLVNKGPGRPVFTAAERAEALLALDCVDDVIVAPGPTAKASIELIRPAVYVKGIDYLETDNPHHKDDVAAVEALGGTVHITRTDKWSSSRIINTERLSDDAVRYLDGARKRLGVDRIQRAFADADKLNILFVGETIVDEYRYVSPLAKPSKEFIMATVEAKEKEPEQFLGGVIAASLHADWQHIKVATDNCGPMKKTRYVDADFGRKLFEVYNKPRLEMTDKQRELFLARMPVRWADVVVVLDFGHGLIDGIAKEHIQSFGKFVAVNAQTNAANYGFNTVHKYERPHLTCVDMPEAQLAAQMQDETDPARLSKRLRGKHVIITHGKHGSYCPQHVPAFTSRTVDTMGAGDAFMSVAAPLIATGLDIEAATFVGNVAGALKTEIVGHRRHVGRQEIVQTVEALLA